MGEKYAVSMEAAKPEVKLLSPEEWNRWRHGELAVDGFVVHVNE